MTDGASDLTITIDTDADDAIEDITALEERVKALNAELEHTIALLDELEGHEIAIQLDDSRISKLETRLLHGDSDD